MEAPNRRDLRVLGENSRCKNEATKMAFRWNRCGAVVRRLRYVVAAEAGMYDR